MLTLFSTALALPCGLLGPLPERPHPLMPRNAGDLLVRDAFDPDLSVYETEHFAVKWGAAGDPTPSQLEQLGADLESVWANQVERMGWVQPTGTEAYKLNVYLGYADPLAPQIDFVGGYVWSDEGGFAYIVVHPDIIDYYAIPGLESEAASLVAHEFHHTLQANDWAQYDDVERSFFWWEATASWSVPYVFQDHELARYGGYQLNPHRSVATWSQDWMDPEVGGRQYDTAAFAYWLSERYGPDLIRRSWEATEAETPMEFLDAELEQGLAETFNAFALDVALGLHPKAQEWEEEARVVASWRGGDNERTYRIPQDGTDDWVTLDHHLRPEGFAWNRLDWDGGLNGQLVVELEPRKPGLTAWLSVRHPDQDPVIHRLDGVRVIDVTDRDEVRLVVVATPDTFEPGTRYGYDFRVQAIERLPRTFEPSGSACSASGGTSAGLDAFLGMWSRR